MDQLDLATPHKLIGSQIQTGNVATKMATQRRDAQIDAHPCGYYYCQKPGKHVLSTATCCGTCENDEKNDHEFQCDDGKCDQQKVMYVCDFHLGYHEGNYEQVRRNCRFCDVVNGPPCFEHAHCPSPHQVMNTGCQSCGNYLCPTHWNAWAITTFGGRHTIHLCEQCVESMSKVDFRALPKYQFKRDSW